MGKAKRLKQKQIMFEIFLDMEIKRKKDAYALRCIKESVDESILPLISDAKTAKEAWDTLERYFGTRGSIEAKGSFEDEGGSVTIDLQRNEEFVETHCAQSQVADVCKESADEEEKQHEDAREPHCA